MISTISADYVQIILLLVDRVAQRQPPGHAPWTSTKFAIQVISGIARSLTKSVIRDATASGRSMYML